MSTPTAVQQLRQQLPYVPQALRLVWQAAPRWTLVWGLLVIAQGLLPVGTVYLTRTVIDSIAALLNGTTTLANIGGPLVLLVSLVVIGEAFGNLSTWVRTAQAEQVQDAVHDLIHAQALKLDLGFYESADYYDRLHRARADALTRPLTLLENFGSLFQNSLTLIAMAGVLMMYGWWLPPLLLLSTLPALYVTMRYTRRVNAWRLNNTQAQRHTVYYDSLLTSRDSAAELRLFQLGDVFRNAFQTIRGRLRVEKVALAQEQAAASAFASASGLLVLGISLLWLMQQAQAGQISFGDIALFHQAFTQGQRLTRTLLNNASQIYGNLLFLDNLFEFLNLQPTITEPEHPHPFPSLTSTIRFEDVTFYYPGSTRPALENFNLTLQAGSIVAIVGENGAGKSTLTKLLCRFYDPDAGRVTIDGHDIRTLSQQAVWQMITILFQQPVQYYKSAGENIAISDLAAEPSAEQILKAAQAAGADVPIDKLPSGYSTQLGKWFGGAELSGGEWQRIALARAFLRQAPIVVLDEPTSAMDSWAEADWMQRFRDLTAGRTALIITHRFTTATYADVVHVMMGGAIVESGTHDELITRNGHYARSWKQQIQHG